MGFRTSWAMEDDYVWKKTQKSAGILFFISGVLSLFSLTLSFKYGLYVLLSSLLISSLITFIYSYLTYRKNKKFSYN